MSYGKRLQQWRREWRLRHMRARDFPDDEQEPELLIEQRIPEEIPESDAKLLEEIGFKANATNRIGRGKYGAVFTATGNDRAVRYHAVRHISGEYFMATFEGTALRYLPVSDTSKVNDNYYVESLEKRNVAIKFVNMTVSADPRLQANFRHEANLLSHLHHPNIVNIYDVVVIGRRLYIIMEYCPDGSLDNFLLFQPTVTESLCRTFVRQLAAGLLYLHNRSVTHGDIHGGNIMLVRSETNETDVTLKFVDFGLANFALGAANRAPVITDLRRFGHLLQRFVSLTNYDDPVLRIRLNELTTRLIREEFATLREAIREYEFLHPEEHSRMRSRLTVT